MSGGTASDGRLERKREVHVRDSLKENRKVKQMHNAPKDSSRLLTAKERIIEGNGKIRTIES